ncbi:MAG: carbohydrate kinase family protein [Lachnospiraceae bacterium]|nr:carbohydrate kinase family protein [Lachnospiraceae bacterium]
MPSIVTKQLESLVPSASSKRHTLPSAIHLWNAVIVCSAFCTAPGPADGTAVSVCTAPGPKVSPIDTTGAGDIFGGSAVSRLLDLGKDIGDLTEEDLAYIGRFATTAASLSTELLGGIPSIRPEAVVLQRMKEL